MSFAWLSFAEIPDNEYIKYFAPDYTLKVSNVNMVWNLFSLAFVCPTVVWCIDIWLLLGASSNCPFITEYGLSIWAL